MECVHLNWQFSSSSFYVLMKDSTIYNHNFPKMPSYLNLAREVDYLGNPGDQLDLPHTGGTSLCELLEIVLVVRMVRSLSHVI